MLLFGLPKRELRRMLEIFEFNRLILDVFISLVSGLGENSLSDALVLLTLIG